MPVPSRPKIINDPVHGFIEIPRGLLIELIDSAVFQRLRRIKQLGLSSLVYPGAVHTRFNHALGALHLMRLALDTLRRKGVAISDDEYQAASIAILLHDVGHGPFSHALETAIIPGLHHEDMSLALMEYLNRQHRGELELAIEIFRGEYHRPFFHQLVSSQLDMDRMDYLIRDSFFTGVVEGVVGIDRIIKTLNVADGRLVCEEKSIYSVEKFIMARRLMYWQVYLHRAAMAAEFMILNLLQRARELVNQGDHIWLDDHLGFFFTNDLSPARLTDEVILRYIALDDNDIEFALKKWQHAGDPVLSEFCRRILRRDLLKIRLENHPLPQPEVDLYRQAFLRTWQGEPRAVDYFVFSGEVSNLAYVYAGSDPIRILTKQGSIEELAAASDLQMMRTLSAVVTKHYLCYPGGLQLNQSTTTNRVE